MKVCVFGASGYVGASVYQLLKESADVNVVGTYLEDPAMFDDLYKLDINQPESFAHFFKREQPDTVIWSVMSGPNEHELTVQGLMHLMTFLTPETKLVYMSTDFVFTKGKGPYSEADTMSKLPEDHLYSNYTNAKVKAEHFIKNELINYAILRAGPIYGENKIGRLDDHTDKLAYHLRSGKPIAFHDDLIRTFVHVDDLANVIIELAQNNVTGTYHVGSERSQSLYEFMRETAEQLGYNMNLVEKESEQETVDQEIPKNTSLNTEKIKQITKQNFR